MYIQPIRDTTYIGTIQYLSVYLSHNTVLYYLYACRYTYGGTTCVTTPTSNSSSQHKHKKSMFFLRVGRGGKFCFLCVFSICFRHLQNSSIGWRRSTTSPQKGHQGGHAEGSPFFHNTRYARRQLQFWTLTDSREELRVCQSIGTQRLW